MLVHKFAALLCSGVLTASALKLAVPNDLGSVPELMYDDAQQNPLGASTLLSQEGTEEVFEGNFKSEPEALSFNTAEKRTIYQILSDSPNFSRLVRIINISDEIVSLLNDTSAGITFFAPNNKALHLPHHRKPRHGLISLALSDPAAIPSDIYSSFDLSEIFSEIEEFEASLVDDENDPDKERRKKFIRILVRAILAYHILPQGLDAPQLARNTTYATNLTVPDGALDKEPLRIRVASSKLFPVIKINVLATVIKPDIGAKNGIIHVINHPLLPPPSIFQELFLFPPYFGGVTSALQRVGLTDALEWRYVSGEDKKWTVEGTGSTTFFVPSNTAFKKLPKKLQLFLFSPFGERVLKKLIKFHIVPGIVLHSDYIHNATSSKTVTTDVCDNSGIESELSDDNLFVHDVDEFDCFGILCHEGRLTPSDFCSHSQPQGLEHHGNFERHLYAPPPPLRREPCGSPHECHSPPPPPPSCKENPHHPPPPIPRGPHGLHSIGGCAPGQGDHSPFLLLHQSFISRPERVFAVNLTLPTLLTNHSLHIHIAKYKLHLPIPGHPKDIYSSDIVVNHQRVAFADVVARNGAVHVINSVLNPRPHHHHPHKPEGNGGNEIYDEDENDSWNDWEDWLPRWAAEN